MLPGWTTAVALLLAAIGGALAGAEPTGTAVVDPALSAALCVFVVAVAAQSNPAAIILAATVAGACGDTTAMALAGAAVLLTLWQPGPARPLAGAALAVAALHLDWPDPFGATAAVAAGIVVLLVVGALPRLTRRTLAFGLLGAGAVLLLGTAGFAVTALGHRDGLQSAVELAERGLDLTREGDTDAAADAFAEAEVLLAGADRDLGRWWVRPVSAVPVLAQHDRAARRLADLALDLVGAAKAATEAAAPERLQVVDGTLDLAVVGDLRPPLTELHQVLDGIPAVLRRASSPWLLGPLVEEMDELEARATAEIGDIETALDATDAAPWLLGEGTTRRYFLAVMTQSENRGGGGFVGNWGILTATDGRLDLEQFGRADDLERLGPFDIDVNPEWNTRYVDGWGVDTYFPRNVLSSPDLPSNAEAIRQASAQAGLGDIDGVIAIDPIAMASLLQLTGPIEVEGWDEPLTADNAVEILMFEQYLDPDDPERLDFLANAAEQLFDRLTSSALPGPADLADLFGPLARAGHLQVTAFDEASSAFLHQVGVEPRLLPPTGDSLLVLTANATPSKSDWFLRSEVVYDVRTTGDEVSATLDITLENTAPGELPGGYFGSPGDDERPENRQLVSIYSPMAVQSAALDGAPIELAGHREAGHQIHETFVVLPPGGRSTLRVELNGGLAQPYLLRLGSQATATPTRARVSIDGAVEHDGPLLGPVEIP